MNNRIHRHMIFNNDLKYNKISFKLQIKLLDSKGKEDELIEKSDLNFNSTEGMFEKTLELRMPEVTKKDSNIKENNDKIKEYSEIMKIDFYEFLTLIKILNLEIESVNYKEEYIIE